MSDTHGRFRPQSTAGESDALRAEVARLRGSFSRYGQHLFGCEVEQTDYCTCGLARAAQEGK